MQTDLMSRVTDQSAFFGKGFKAVAWDKPRCFHVIFLEEIEEATGSNCAGEQAWVEGYSVYQYQQM